MQNSVYNICSIKFCSKHSTVLLHTVLNGTVFTTDVRISNMETVNAAFLTNILKKDHDNLPIRISWLSSLNVYRFVKIGVWIIALTRSTKTGLNSFNTSKKWTWTKWKWNFLSKTSLILVTVYVMLKVSWFQMDF